MSILLLSLCRIYMFVSVKLLHFLCGFSAISYAFAFDKYHLCCANVIFNS